jgi:hypothetical protein
MHNPTGAHKNSQGVDKAYGKPFTPFFMGTCGLPSIQESRKAFYETLSDLQELEKVTIEAIQSKSKHNLRLELIAALWPFGGRHSFSYSNVPAWWPKHVVGWGQQVCVSRLTLNRLRYIMVCYIVYNYSTSRGDPFVFPDIPRNVRVTAVPATPQGEIPATPPDTPQSFSGSDGDDIHSPPAAVRLPVTPSRFFGSGSS